MMAETQTEDKRNYPRQYSLRNLNKEKTFFISDLHLFHGNIIKYCNRPFPSFEEMNEAMIKAWNLKVPKDGIVFIVGDVAMKAKTEKVVAALKSLNGAKILVRGNHDSEYLHSVSFKDCFAFITDILDITVKDPEREGGQTDFVLCHYAMRTWNRKGHGAIQLFGHSHGTLPPVDLQLDVGADTAPDFSPYSYDEILIRLWKEYHSPRNFFARLLVNLATFIGKTSLQHKRS